MGQARHLLSLLVLVGVALAAVVGGCGSSDETSESSSSGAGPATRSTAPQGATAQACSGAVAGISQVRVSGVGCAVARGIVASWDNRKACGAPAGGSRTSCSVEDYRCLGAATDRGLSVSCAAPGGSISFVAKRS
ncbi:MAG: hypothetical protein QOF85_191 [Solirubrobacterales bacterium]|jgi:hypothetical protein|nr:hypothetical protein [Solirubrobacterales bacterium]